MTDVRRNWPWVWALALLPLLGWWTYGLFDLDEGFYGAVVMEMNRRHEWITPYFNGQPWFEKPILLYWAAKPFVAMFPNEFGARLPSVLATLATAGIIAWFARRRFNEATAQISVLVYASSLLVVGAGRMMLTDPLLVLCITVAFTTFYESLVGDKRWRLVSAFLLGIAALAKGPVAAVIFLIAAALTYWRIGELRKEFRGYWLIGLWLLALAVCTWYVPAYIQNGQLFVQKFLLEQNVGRFRGGDEAHKVTGLGGLVFYIPILLLGVAPWIFALPKATKVRTPVERFLWIWFWVVFAFFTISAAKLVHYVLPCVPPLALLLGAALERSWHGFPQLRLRQMGAWTLGVGALAQWGFSLYSNGGSVFGQTVPGFHAEVQRIAKRLKNEPDPIVSYQLSRRSKSLGTGKPKVQETSHPSILFYLDRVITQTDKGLDDLNLKPGTWVITRWNRITPADELAMRRKHLVLEAMAMDPPSDLYRLFRVMSLNEE